jgi:hypothetical protein
MAAEGGGGDADDLRGAFGASFWVVEVEGLPLATLSSDDDSDSDSDELDDSEDDSDVSAGFAAAFLGCFWGTDLGSSSESDSEDDEDDDELVSATRLFLLRFRFLGAAGLAAGGGIVVRGLVVVVEIDHKFSQ